MDNLIQNTGNYLSTFILYTFKTLIQRIEKISYNAKNQEVKLLE
jgi:hypothetical protein